MSSKFYLEERETKRENGAAALRIARLQHTIREIGIRLQPDAGDSAGALDPVRLPRLPPFSLHHRAPNPVFPRPILLRARQIEETSKSPLNRLPKPRTAAPNRLQIATSKPPPAPHKEMGQQSKRMRAPAPLDPAASHLVPAAAPQLVLPPVPPFLPPLPHRVLSSSFPSTHGSTPWIPPRPASVASSSAQGPCWAPPAGVGGSTYPWHMAENTDVSDPQTWGLDSHPPGGFLSFFKNTPSHTQAVGNGTLS
uniref:Uncharacterized protein n=4 Tax=Avena sativa TaxID=4498 RepID=A0ACD5VNH6_AVESA